VILVYLLYHYRWFVSPESNTSKVKYVAFHSCHSIQTITQDFLKPCVSLLTSAKRLFDRLVLTATFVKQDQNCGHERLLCWFVISHYVALHYVGLPCGCFTIEGQNPSDNFLYTGGGARLDAVLHVGKKPSSDSSSASDAEVR